MGSNEQDDFSRMQKNSKATCELLDTNEIIVDAYITEQQQKQSIQKCFSRKCSFDCNQYSVGDCNIVCRGCRVCRAKHFRHETKKTQNKPFGTFSKCCNFGDLSILTNTLFNYPDELRDLFNSVHKFHTIFLNNIRLINSNMSVASLQSVKKVENKMYPGSYISMPGEVRFKGGIPIYKIQSTIYHKFNQVAVPDSNQMATNGQLFYVDTNESLILRNKLLQHKKKDVSNNNRDLFEELVKYIDEILRKTYCQNEKSAISG